MESACKEDSQSVKHNAYFAKQMSIFKMACAVLLIVANISCAPVIIEMGFPASAYG